MGAISNFSSDSNSSYLSKWPPLISNFANIAISLPMLCLISPYECLTIFLSEIHILFIPVPSKPVSITCEPRSSSILVEWEPLPKRARNGEITQYKIFYRQVGEYVVQQKPVVIEPALSYLITGEWWSKLFSQLPIYTWMECNNVRQVFLFKKILVANGK